MGERDGVSKVKKALPRRLSRPGEVTGDRTRRRGAGASGEVSQGLTRRYRVEHGQASGGRAGIGRLAVLQVLYRRTGCSVSVLHRRAEGWRSVSRDDLTNSWLGGTRLCELVGRRYRHGAASEDSDNTTETWDTCRWMLLLLAVANSTNATASWANSYTVARRCSSTDGQRFASFTCRLSSSCLPGESNSASRPPR